MAVGGIPLKPPFCSRFLYACDFTGFQSASAHVYTLWLAVYKNPDFLNVNAPGTTITVVRVRYVVSGTRSFAGYKTFASHCRHHPSVANIVLNIS